MAIISLLCGSIFGALSALTSLIFLDVGWLAALGIWSLGGAVMSFGLLAIAMMPAREVVGLHLRQAAGTPDFS